MSKWAVLKILAEAEQGDILGRQIGAPLFPERLSPARMLELKTSDITIWRALYQQAEEDYSGTWFDKSYLQFYKKLDVDLLNRYIIVDPANSKKKTSDYTTMFVFGAGEDRNYYWLHMLRDRLDPDERATSLLRLHRIYKPLLVGYEEYGMQGDIFYVNRVMEERNYRFHIEPLGMRGSHRGLSKQDRIRTLTPLYRAGLMYMPEHQTLKLITGEEVDVAQLFIEKEYLRYPRVSHDDMLDVMARITDPLMNIEFPIASDLNPKRDTAPAYGRTWVSA